MKQQEIMPAYSSLKRCSYDESQFLFRIALIFIVLAVLTFIYWQLGRFIEHYEKAPHQLLILGIIAAITTLFLGSFLYVYHGLDQRIFIEMGAVRPIW